MSNFSEDSSLIAISAYVLFFFLQVLVALSDQCQDGKNAGEIEIKMLWKNPPFTGNCDNIWQLDAAVQELKLKEYPENTGNPMKDSYNECARTYGIDPQVKAIKKSCVSDDSTPCIKIGETAAVQIAYEYCPKPKPEPYSTPEDTLQQCRDLAITICKGILYDKIKFVCGVLNMPTTSGLNHLMQKCPEKVDGLTTPKTVKPTSVPSQDNRDGRNMCSLFKDSNTAYPPGTFCFKARQDCCSSKRKYEHWTPFCIYYGLPKPAMSNVMLDDQQQQGTIMVDATDCTLCGYQRCPKTGETARPTQKPTVAAPGSNICTYAPDYKCWPGTNSWFKGWPSCCIDKSCVPGLSYPCEHPLMYLEHQG